jgi:hypothetical protein
MYRQLVLSAPAKLPVMIKKGRKEVQATYTTKSGQVKNKYRANPLAQVIKVIKHKTPVVFK